MDITEISIMHHVGIVLFVLWLLSVLNRCQPVAYFVSLIYLYLIHERYAIRLRKKLQFEERKQANQKRVLSDSETVRWLNHAVEKIWPICMEQIASQKILLPIIPWFLEKYKPWTVKKAMVQHMYLGRSPPMFTEMRVLHQCTGDDHLVLELGMSFRTADDMSAILAVKLRRRLGFGMSAKLHMTGIHVEGKVLVGVKFLRHWPFIGRLRICFAEPPYFQMTVKPIFTHGLDVTELPGIAGWLDKLLSVAFEQTLVQPNMLVVDLEKFVSPQPESWFSVDEKEPIAYVKVEVMEASDMKPSDLNGLADPYVKGHLGPYRFTTKILKKTLAPKWLEEFKIPICTWESPNVLTIEVRDKDHFVDDTLGDCTININDHRDGERHDMWLSLQNIKMGRLHLAITVLEENAKEVDITFNGENLVKEEISKEEILRKEEISKKETWDSFTNETANRASFSSASPEKSPKVPDNFEPINIDGQQETGIWVHHPGSEVLQTWEPRKGKSRRIDTEVQRVPNDSCGSTKSTSGPLNDSSSTDESAEGKNTKNIVRRGLKKISSVFHRNNKNEDTGSSAEPVQSPYANIRAINQKEIGVKFIVDDSLRITAPGRDLKEVDLSPGGSGPESPSRGHVKDMAKSIFRHAEKSAFSIKHALSRKGTRKSRADSSVATEREIDPESESSNDEFLSSPQVQGIPIVSIPIIHNVEKTSSSENDISSTEGSINKLNVEVPERLDDDEMSNAEENGLQKLSKPQPSENSLERERMENVHTADCDKAKGCD